MLNLPIIQLAIVIFILEFLNVCLSTIRMLYMVDKNILMAGGLAFIEVIIWTITVANVINRVKESWILIVIFAGGFAVGQMVGIFIKKRYLKTSM